MKPSFLVVVAVAESLNSFLLGEEACMLGDSAEPLRLLLEGLKASTAGLSLDLTLSGVTRSTSKGLVMVVSGPEAEEDEVTAFLSMLMVSVSLGTVK